MREEKEELPHLNLELFGVKVSHLNTPLAGFSLECRKMAVWVVVGGERRGWRMEKWLSVGV